MTSAERRKTLRVGLTLPVRVQGFEADGSSWNETSSTADISAGGISFPLGRSVALGQVLLLVLPLPKRLRQYDLNDASYRVYTLVRGVHHKADQTRIGVMFFGKFPPRGFLDHPGARFLLPSDAQGAPGAVAQEHAPAEAPVPTPAAQTSPEATLRPSSSAPPPPVPPQPRPAAPPPDAVARPADAPTPPVVGAPGGKERRQHARFSLFVNFTLQQVDEFGAILQEELTVADSMGKGGAQVMTTLDFSPGDVVWVQEAGGGFATRAEVRSITRGSDGVGRLHLKFLDRTAPDRVLQR